MWSEAAINRTFRAVTEAGFNADHFPNLREIVMLSEPEATALSIAKTIRTRFGERPLVVSFVRCPYVAISAENLARGCFRCLRCWWRHGSESFARTKDVS